MTKSMTDQENWIPSRDNQYTTAAAGQVFQNADLRNARPDGIVVETTVSRSERSAV